MKALSIKQPWASLITLGLKDIENRTWRTNYRGRIYVHASAKYAHQYPHEALSDEQFDALPGEIQNELLLHDYPVSAIIGEVDIVDCVINHPSVWAEFTEGVAYNPGAYPNGVHTCFGREAANPIYNWVLANPVQFDEPILNVKGKLSFWEYNRITTRLRAGS